MTRNTVVMSHGTKAAAGTEPGGECAVRAAGRATRLGITLPRPSGLSLSESRSSCGCRGQRHFSTSDSEGYVNAS